MNADKGSSGEGSVGLVERLESVEEKVIDFGFEVEQMRIKQEQVVARLENLESTVEALQMNLGTHMHEVKEAQQRIEERQKEMLEMIRDWTLP